MSGVPRRQDNGQYPSLRKLHKLRRLASKLLILNLRKKKRNTKKKRKKEGDYYSFDYHFSSF